MARGPARRGSADRLGTDEPESGDTTMSDIVSKLAAESGLSPDQAQKGLGAVLSFFKQSLPEKSFEQVSAAVPDSDQIMAAAGPHEEPSGGILESIKGMASKLFGGGGASASALLAKLSNLGISLEQAKAFLPRVMEFFKSKLPDSLMKQVSGLLPMPQETPA
ncbi:MAG TPA: DUF2780 domain-containing protein [Gemmataceae bacterium]|nr:DUF2780 domain-containing protein [Gemmataceae bacterium]